MITGAGSGIGRALAVELSARGARLALSDRNGDALAATARRCGPSSGDLRTDVVDVTDRPAVMSYADSVAGDLEPVDVVFSVAGVLHTGSVLASSFVDVEEVFAVNYWGVVNTTKAFLPHVTKAEHGHIVTISSVFGLMTAPRYSAYCASKFAVRAFTESLRQEMIIDRKPVSVTCVYPGGIRTPIMRNGLFAAGEDRTAVTNSFDRVVARTSPERAATRILRGVERRRARVLVGADARVIGGLLRGLGDAYPHVIPSLARLTRILRGSAPG
ncbi:SDR family NAD(P)-dependent oxidoreductase [Pseudonocardia cypriaca]|uniref:SDR family NAD(P)-dependent oxidoreductase n=1 Tax=Pseudonocardia cypriaca TaxID=882449 RepID=UPI001FE41523|nr:SDR family NAD(P)-dependent oxidoreductase [Pseudonocardia cypriaca]